MAPSTHLWEDDSGEVHTVPQGEGGEQGDPLMPLLFCLEQRPALTAVRAELEEGEKLFAYLDDLYIVCAPGRVGEVHDLLKRHLRGHSKISIHAGKTKVWNRSGTFPPACVGLQRAARLASPGAVVCPRTNRGSRCLVCLSGILISWRNFWRGRSQSIVFCWIASLKSPTPSRRGCSCPIFPPQGGLSPTCSTIRSRP